ncbi:MAG: patatin-like phospholipase family protein [Candidatus Gastranaerophilales bacterium]|nr:patatin-like phospholipase family protein [Candidatus Gastranaerophilales bacterium]
MEKSNKSLEYTCIFGGGAARGISYVGTVKALEELEIKMTTIAGSSVGAIFAGLLAVGYNAQELKEIFMHVSYELFKDIHFGFGKGFALSKGGIFLDWLRELIEKKYYGEAFNKEGNPPVKFTDLDKNLVIITTDLTNFKYKEFSKFETPDFEVAYAIRISSTMPGLMKPIEHDGALLVDGDLQKSWPMWRLSKNLCPENERILEFRLEGDYEGKGQNPVNFANTIYSCVTSLATDFIIDTYGYRDKFDYIKINTGSVIVVNFNLPKEKREELMQIGYCQTMNYFKSDLPQKKREVLKYYKQILQHVQKIKKLIFSNKINQAQNQLGMLYMDFHSAGKFIDLKYYDIVDEFKNIFIPNIIAAPLIGFYSLKNSKLIKSQISSIEKQLEDKVTELESY